MREQRWESNQTFSLAELLAVTNRLNAKGLKTTDPDRETICYIEEWEVDSPEEVERIHEWLVEDITMVQVFDEWAGDFFLFAGGYHSLFQQYQSVDTYCSISHPWTIPGHLATLYPEARFWLGFRHRHSFIRVRLHTCSVIAPGETWGDHQRPIWLEEREHAFAEAISLLEIPITVSSNDMMVQLHSEQQDVPFFCSWPDAFGPCQFEFNSFDPFQFLVPASRLAATHQETSAPVRVYLTGFPPEALIDFSSLQPQHRTVYRCSTHCCLNELPDILDILGRCGRLYTTICEFQTQDLLPSQPNASAIIGIASSGSGLQLELRCNLMPLPQTDMEHWLHDLLGVQMTYAPLSPFP